MIRTTSLLLLAMLASTPAWAQDSAQRAVERSQALQAAAAPGKQIFIARQLKLTPEEAATFWPVYDAHQSEASAIAERRARLLAERDEKTAAGDFDEGDAVDLAEDLAALDTDEAELAESTLVRLLRAGFPVAKATLYLTLENDLRAQRQLGREGAPDYVNQ